MDFERLNVWKRSARLSASLYRHFADSRDFGFKDQITRSGLSVPSNIAEGMTRPSVKDRIKFLYIAKGSCAELRTQIYIGVEIGYIEREKGNEWVKETKEIAAMLTGLIRKQGDFDAG
ncbi:four helix bundle protein [Halomonas faecis]|uniref:four helix bundle protein n=1 Tax=Halomonas faecis TaxID=1562110 RepID=UPI0013D89A0C|nr:four helix bundle protein [Halomonas faecis]